jgi:uncharacterized membrane protein
MFWIFPVFCLLFFIFVIAMLVMLFRRGGACLPMRLGADARPGSHHETARHVLDRRYAAGEITKKQYGAMKRDIDSQ